MSKLRPTGTFTPILEDLADGTDAAGEPLPPRRPTGMPATVWRTLQDLRDLSIPEGSGAAGSRPAWRELPDLPRRATLAPRADAGGTSLRRAESNLPGAQRNSPPPSPQATAALEMAMQMNQRQRSAAIAELFEEAQMAAEQLVASLDDWAEDRTPTHRTRDIDSQRRRLRRTLSDLSALVQADKEGHAGGWALAPEQYRQLRLLSEAFDVDASLRREQASGEDVSPNQVLLRRLRDALSAEDEIYRPSRRR